MLVGTLTTGFGAKWRIYRNGAHWWALDADGVPAGDRILPALVAEWQRIRPIEDDHSTYRGQPI